MKTLRELVVAAGYITPDTETRLLDKPWTLITRPELATTLANMEFTINDRNEVVTDKDLISIDDELLIHVNYEKSGIDRAALLLDTFGLIGTTILSQPSNLIRKLKSPLGKIIYTVTYNDSYETQRLLDTDLVAQRLLSPDAKPQVVTVTIHATPRQAKEFLSGKQQNDNCINHYNLFLSTNCKYIIEHYGELLEAKRYVVIRTLRWELIRYLELLPLPPILTDILRCRIINFTLRGVTRLSSPLKSIAIFLDE